MWFHLYKKSRIIKMNPSKQEMNRLKVKANMKVIPEIHIKKN